MKENIKTALRLSAPLVVAIVPFMLMRIPAPSCSTISGISICASSSTRPSILVQVGISLLAALVILTAYLIWKSQLKAISKSGSKLWFSGFHLVTSIAATVAALLFYKSIQDFHSQEAPRYAYALNSGSQPYFGWGLRPLILYILLALYILPILMGCLEILKLKSKKFKFKKLSFKL